MRSVGRMIRHGTANPWEPSLILGRTSNTLLTDTPGSASEKDSLQGDGSGVSFNKVLFGGSTLGECARLLTENEVGSNPTRRANIMPREPAGVGARLSTGLEGIDTPTRRHYNGSVAQ